jgi:hypothetical protein
MAKRKGKKAKPTDVVARFVRPTEAREAHNDFEGAGAAVRVVPVIETMRRAGKISQAEFDRLDYYREQAHQAEDDMAQCSTLAPERIMGGGGTPAGGKLPSILLATPAILECARIERDLGSLRDIARAVAVDDWSLTRWAIHQGGGRERFGVDREGNEIVVAMIPRDPKAVEYARIELRFAAGRIAR